MLWGHWLGGQSERGAGALGMKGMGRCCLYHLDPAMDPDQTIRSLRGHLRGDTGQGRSGDKD